VHVLFLLVFSLAAGITLAIKGAGASVAFFTMLVASSIDALIAGATPGEAFKAGIISGLSAAAFVKVGQHFKELGIGNSYSWDVSDVFHNFGGNLLSSGQIAQQIAAHAVIGGVTAVLQGGKFGHGFPSAGVTKGVTGAVHGGNFGVRLTASAVVGGTTSKISGGKFANGARAATFQFLFNEWLGTCSCNSSSGNPDLDPTDDWRHPLTVDPAELPLGGAVASPRGMDPEDPENKKFHNRKTSDYIHGVRRHEFINKDGIYYVNYGGNLTRTKRNYDYVTINGHIWVSKPNAGHANLARSK